jgi:Flp pilus assembly protein TadD
MQDGLKLAGSGDAEVYSLLAKSYFIENSLDSAAINLRKVTALDPADAQAHYNLVVIYMKTGERDSAAAEILKIRQNGLRVPPELEKLVGAK